MMARSSLSGVHPGGEDVGRAVSLPAVAHCRGRIALSRRRIATSSSHRSRARCVYCSIAASMRPVRGAVDVAGFGSERCPFAAPARSVRGAGWNGNGCGGSASAALRWRSARSRRTASSSAAHRAHSACSDMDRWPTVTLDVSPQRNSPSAAIAPPWSSPPDGTGCSRARCSGCLRCSSPAGTRCVRHCRRAGTPRRTRRCHRRSPRPSYPHAHRSSTRPRPSRSG